MTMPASAVELSRSRVRSYDKTPQPKLLGQRQWLVAHADADSAEDAAWSEKWTQGGSVMRPTSVKVVPNALPGRDSLIVGFEGYDMVFFPQGKATVSMITAKTLLEQEEVHDLTYNAGSAGAPSWITLDLKGEPGSNGLYYRQTGGPRIRYKPSTQLWLHTGIRRSGYDQSEFMNLSGALNQRSFMGAPALTVMVTGVETPKYYLVDDSDAVVPVSYVLLVRPTPWPTEITARCYARYVAIEDVVANFTDNGVPDVWWDSNGEPVTDHSTLDIEDKQRVIRGMLVGGVYTESIITENEGLFDHLRGLVSWA